MNFRKKCHTVTFAFLLFNQKKNKLGKFFLPLCSWRKTLYYLFLRYCISTETFAGNQLLRVITRNSGPFMSHRCATIQSFQRLESSMETIHFYSVDRA